MATETQENEASSLGDEWQWINNETAEVLRATVENAFFADPRKNWSAEELARWIRDVALVSAKENVWDHAAALGEFLVNGLGYVTGEPTVRQVLQAPHGGEDHQQTRGKSGRAGSTKRERRKKSR